MLTLPPTTRVFVARDSVDMRRSFDGLAALVRDFLQNDPLSGHLFVFRNRGGDRLKILWWDRDGLALYYKRLEQGSFPVPRMADGALQIELTPEDLQLLLQGLDPTRVERPRRFSLSSLGR